VKRREGVSNRDYSDERGRGGEKVARRRHLSGWRRKRKDKGLAQYATWEVLCKSE